MDLLDLLPERQVTILRLLPTFDNCAPPLECLVLQLAKSGIYKSQETHPNTTTQAPSHFVLESLLRPNA